ncbi:MAG: cell division protein ZapD [Aquabacterium sp.]
MVLYEYPLNESIRTMLRLEHLFQRLGELMVRDAPVDHHFALVTLFEIMDVASRADLKSDVLKELERHRGILDSWRDNAQVEQSVLQQRLSQIDTAHGPLNQLAGKAGHVLTTNDWLMSVRSRIGIPGGTCEFDLPAYYAWQQLDPARRRSDLAGWVATMAPLAQALQVLMRLLRDSGVPQMVAASGGQYQRTLPQGRGFQLLRLRISGEGGLVPEISGHRLLVSVRLMRTDTDGRLRPSSEDASFELALCA